MSYKIFQIAEFVRKNLQNPPTKEYLCGYFSITDYSLRKGFKQNFGMNVGEYIRTQRIKSAAKLLAGSDNLITSIATFVGFQNASKFAETFRRYYGVNPSDYRNSVKHHGG